MHGQMSLAAVNKIGVIHEAMNSYKISKDSLKDCFENVNIGFHKAEFNWWEQCGCSATFAL